MLSYNDGNFKTNINKKEVIGMLNNEDWGKTVADEVIEAADKYESILDILERGEEFGERAREIVGNFPPEARFQEWKRRQKEEGW